MNSEEYFNRLSKVKDFPSIPEISRKLADTLNNEDSDVDDVAKIIMQDPALTAKIIKISNSSYFHLREKVTSIQKAVSVLGFKLISQLTLTTGIIHSFMGSKKSTDRKLFWQHSLGVAICAKIIAGHFGASQNQQDHLFTIGILHDLGKMVTEKYFPAEYDRIINLLDAEPLAYWEAEQKVLGVTHAETGSWIARNWNFDPSTVHVIAYHHAVSHGFKFISENDKFLLSVINLSDTIIKDLKFGNSGDKKLEPVNPLVVKQLDLSIDQVKNYINDLKSKLQDIDSFVSSSL